MQSLQLPSSFVRQSPNGQALAHSRTPAPCARVVRTRSLKAPTEEKPTQAEPLSDRTRLEGTLGSIGVSASGAATKNATNTSSGSSGSKTTAAQHLADSAGLSLGPISLSFTGDPDSAGSSAAARAAQQASSSGGSQEPDAPSISSLSTEEWRSKYERDGMVDLWLEDEFSAGSRLVGGRAVHNGLQAGYRTGEGPSGGAVPVHKITVHNHYADQVLEVEVPEDRYILFEAEDQGLELPYACRMGCCTACAVRVREGQLEQTEALGVSAELRAQGYALMCVAYPTTDCVLETVPEDEVYELQFGRFFAQQALDPDAETVERDDFALEIAHMDE